MNESEYLSSINMKTLNLYFKQQNIHF